MLSSNRYWVPTDTKCQQILSANRLPILSGRFSNVFYNLWEWSDNLSGSERKITLKRHPYYIEQYNLTNKRYSVRLENISILTRFPIKNWDFFERFWFSFFKDFLKFGFVLVWFSCIPSWWCWKQRWCSSLVQTLRLRLCFDLGPSWTIYKFWNLNLSFIQLI